MREPFPEYGGPAAEDPAIPAQLGPDILTRVLEDPLWLTVFSGLGVAVGILMFIAVARSLLFIARPNEALVLSGRKYTAPNGTVLPNRLYQQGRRGWRIPVLERVDRIDMRLLPIDILVPNAYSAGNIPLQIHAIANVKIHSDQAHIRNAVERFLGRSLVEVQKVAQQTLEGSVREVIATMTPEEVNEDRLKFAEKLVETAEDDLHKLGLQLDTLKIQNVSDETGYLDSLGRPRIAAVLRDAENAENEAKQEITRAQADASRRADVAKAACETAVLQKQNELRQVQAELDGEAQSVEREAEAAAKTARATAEKELQALRADLENKRLQADVVIPAETHREAQALLAVGEAAPTAENGAAVVEVLRQMSDAWRAMGPQAREIYIIQHLEEIIHTVVSNLDEVDVGEVSVLDQGDGKGLASYAATYPQMVSAVMSALGETTGVDIGGILNGQVSSTAAERSA